MTENNFVFADLSTYNLDTARLFYSRVFDWNYSSEDGSYFMATYNAKEIVGIYETPQKFKDMNMPSFWMSYIQVKSVRETADKAKQLGGIVELVDTENTIGAIALIRDPLGAGFTVYEGNVLKHRYENQTNALIWNELFISDLKKIKPFYEGIFNWKISKAKGQRHAILDSQEKAIGHINVIPNDIKGKDEYWGVFFAVEDLATTKRNALEHGGSVIYADETLTALSDPFGAFFHIIPLEKNSGDLSRTQPPKSIKWKPLLGLGLILTYFFTEWSWIWALFFAFWVMMDVQSGRTHLLETVERKQHPILYWIIVGIWALLGIYSVLFYYGIP
ncbi:MAG: VOC family protein [Bacteroidota bacterium]